MIINHLILHVLDFVSDICVFSQVEHPLDNPDINSFIGKHIARAHTGFTANSGIFKRNSAFVPLIKETVDSAETFINISHIIAELIYDNLSISDYQGVIDLVIVDYSLEDELFFAILMLECKNSFTHQVINDNGLVKNFVIQYHSTLPGVSQKIDSYAIINKHTREILFSDKKRYIEGKDVYVLRDKVLQCSEIASGKEVIKTVNNIVRQVADMNGQNSAVALAKAKNFIYENAEIADILLPEQIGEDVFADSDKAQQDYRELAAEAQLPKKIMLEKKIALRTGRNHKFKTDIGIEIVIPTEYFENPKYVEFKNNIDGTISIELKNIGKIVNK